MPEINHAKRHHLVKLPPHHAFNCPFPGPTEILRGERSSQQPVRISLPACRAQVHRGSTTPPPSSFRTGPGGKALCAHAPGVPRQPYAATLPTRLRDPPPQELLLLLETRWTKTPRECKCASPKHPSFHLQVGSAGSIHVTSYKILFLWSAFGGIAPPGELASSRHPVVLIHLLPFANGPERYRPHPQSTMNQTCSWVGKTE